VILALAFVICQLDTDLLVNDDTTGGFIQVNPAVCCDDSGHFYCVWTDYRAGDYDSDIYLQKFLPDGRKTGHNVNLSVDLPSRNIWSYTSDHADIIALGERILLVERNRQCGTFEIYLEVFDHGLRRVAPRMRVNDDAPGSEHVRPRLGAVGRERFVVVWEDMRDGARAIYGQVFDTSGRARGPNFRVSELAQPSESRPAVAGWSGGFAALWVQTDTDSCRVQGRRFDPDGEPLGPSFTVFDGSLSNPFCAMDTGGSFWAGAEETSRPERNVMISLFGPDGALRGGPFRVNDAAPMAAERWPAASVLPDRARMLVTFVDQRVTEGVWAQWIDSLGNRQGGNFQICGAQQGRTTPRCALQTATDYAVVWEDSRDRHQDIYYYHSSQGEMRANDDVASAIQDFPCVAIDEQGNSLVAWFDYRNALWDGDIYAQWYDREGNRSGANFRVNDDGLNNHQHFLRLAMNRRGDAVAVWRDCRRGGHDYFGQVFDRNRARVGPNFRVTDSVGDYYIPHVALNDEGDFVVTWSRNGQVYGQAYRRTGERIGDNRRLGEGYEWASCCMLSDLEYWVAWPQWDSVRIARFDSLGEPLTRAIAVAAASVPGQVGLFQDPLGILWAAWAVTEQGGVELYGRRMDADGRPLGGVFRINDDTARCERFFPCWACDGEIVYVTFTDFRAVGNINVMAQMFDLAGDPVAGNYVVNADPYPWVHNWAWQSVAAVAGGYVAFAWVDNRNHRSWDTYFRLHSDITGVREAAARPRRVPARVARPGSLALDLPATGEPVRVRLFDRTGRMAVALFDGPAAGRIELPAAGISAGVYFLRIESARGVASMRLLLVN
jgi:hypothetical protein